MHITCKALVKTMSLSNIKIISMTNCPINSSFGRKKTGSINIDRITSKVFKNATSFIKSTAKHPNSYEFVANILHTYIV